MHTVKSIKSLVIIFLLSILAACSDGGLVEFSGSTNSSAVFNGQVADGYLSGARVFLDRNKNRTLDSGEPWAMSEAQGHFSLNIAEGESELYPVVAEIIAGQTVDEDQPHQYVAESYQLEAPAGKGSFISPLTTLIKNEMDKHPELSVLDAENKIKSQLGLNASISLFQDYIRDNNLEYAHRAARIIAGMMANIQAGIELNVGAANTDSQRNAVALMISDQVMNNCDAIAQSLVSAVNQTAVNEILTAILAEINTFALDSALLDRYVERIQNPGLVWDMTPPDIVSQRPANGGRASIDVTVSMTLDEGINPETLANSMVSLSGPTGPVTGVVSYDATLKQLNFIPDSYLMAFSSYQITLSGITDNYGNPLGQTEDWSFTTIFDQLPPELPEF